MKAELPDLGLDIIQIVPVHGGSTGTCLQIYTAERRYFYKADAENPQLIHAELVGRQALEQAGVPVPKLISSGKDYFLCEWIEARPKTDRFWEQFGALVARLHLQAETRLGFPTNNYIGLTPQKNTPMIKWQGFGDWVQFFTQYRLDPQLQQARTQARWTDLLESRCLNLRTDLSSILAGEDSPPCLIHGDLWAGNYLCSDQDQPVLLDPAVSWSHREMEFGMICLFGNMPERFFAAYNDVYPLAAGWENRVVVYKLYHLLNHFNLFGEAYVHDIDHVLRRFGH